MKYSHIILIINLLSLVLVSCVNQVEQKEEPITTRNFEESLLAANRDAVKVEDQQIDDFIARHKLEMWKSGTGLRYMIYERAKGQEAKEGKIAMIEYSVQLLNGDLIYSSEETGNKEFIIGKGVVEAGLEEGILLLKEGDRAKFIIPSHLGFGLMGDQDKIPPKATLIYDVKLLKIKDK